MGKKTRTGIGRRTILQLSPSGPRSLAAGGTNAREEAVCSGSDDEQEAGGDGHSHISQDASLDTRTPAVKATEGLSLLGAYEDSDEEEEVASQPPTANAKLNQSADIDSTLANFMAEIDAITTQPAQSSEEPAADPSAPAAAPAPSPTPPRPNPKEQTHAHAQNGQEEGAAGAEFQYDTQYSLAGVGVEMGDWQEVWDENTGCYYYWNTQTNEVAWQLPHYLAHQVQGLQQYVDSSGATVNGSSVQQSSAFYPEQNTTSFTGSASRREVKKEVIECEVKEAEERWRKKLLGLGEEGPEGRQDSEGEGTRPGSPVPGDSDTHSQGNHRSRAQSPESSEAEEEEAEEDTMELELALERKKAELRALEEGDGSAGAPAPAQRPARTGPGVRSRRRPSGRLASCTRPARTPTAAARTRRAGTPPSFQTQHIPKPWRRQQTSIRWRQKNLQTRPNSNLTQRRKRKPLSSSSR
ncbi:hypothetical protein AGOR_G00170580 [Albula goreensis]|uniref:WW domain-containing protein n=1 Tax=Albula goreensis TaxID=1534307 RepID=A0A8T3D660_9TELE|nr:hypothetical protein AGOR_G00170580 [Albula goreensis]